MPWRSGPIFPCRGAGRGSSPEIWARVERIASRSQATPRTPGRTRRPCARNTAASPNGASGLGRCCRDRPRQRVQCNEQEADARAAQEQAARVRGRNGRCSTCSGQQSCMRREHWRAPAVRGQKVVDLLELAQVSERAWRRRSWRRSRVRRPACRASGARTRPRSSRPRGRARGRRGGGRLAAPLRGRGTGSPLVPPRPGGDGPGRMQGRPRGALREDGMLPGTQARSRSMPTRWCRWSSNWAARGERAFERRPRGC